MAAPTDMTKYVTHAELHAELEQRFAPYGNLAAFGTALIDRIERGEQRLLDGMERRLQQMERRLLDELARHTKAANEEMRTYIAALDDKFTSLPARVERLEATVFPPKRQRRR